MKQHFKIWEISLLFAICMTLCVGLWAGAQQRQLAGELVRLHVIAQSDSEDDQHLKLKVRDAVLASLGPSLEKADNLEDAKRIINEQLQTLCDIADYTAVSEGKNYTASASLCNENYPTREYDGFALPAGDYLSLKIILGEGRGRNWWCVVFPPLCMTAASDEDAMEVLSEDSRELISKQDDEYRLKFHIVEIFERFRSSLA